MPQTETILDEARRLIECGLSIIPIKPDGSKAPAVRTWTPYQFQRASPTELGPWFHGRQTGIAVINGAVSGNLETLDFDEQGLLDEYLALCVEHGLGELLDTLPIVATPSGGFHVYYRSESAPPKNLKIAWRLWAVQPGMKLSERGSQEYVRWGKDEYPVVTQDGKKFAKVIGIETRGEGGYAIIPPTPPQCHPDRKEYVYLCGHLAAVPTITEGQRNALITLAQTFNEYVEPERIVGDRRPRQPQEGARPGDDYNARGDWEKVLEGAGWTPTGRRGDKTVWTRPGKSHGISGTSNYGGSNLFYVFSSNAAPFDAQKAYTPFAVYALLQHGGDFAGAARQLGMEGYGEPPRKPGPQPPSDADAPPHKPGAAKGENRCTDLGNARRLVERHGQDLRYVHAWNRWLIWDGRKWGTDESGAVSRRAFSTVASIYQEAAAEPDEDRRKVLGSWAVKSESAQKLAAMVNTARDQAEMPAPIDALDTDTFLLNCLNGTLDLRTGELLPHTREHLISKIAPVDYDARASCPRWLEFLSRILGADPAMLGFVQRCIGYSLTGDTRRHGFFILHGKGRNGKSTFIETIRAMLGDYALETPAESLMAKKGDTNASNDIARLRGARFVSAGESEEGQRLAENLIKRLSGGDTMTARFLHQEFFEFKPQFKLYLATNHKPVIRGTDEGIWRRVNLIPFEVQIPLAEVDETLGAKLRAELPGILAWAVRGCLEWQKNGIAQPEAVAQATQDYRAEMDTLGAFLEQKCYQAPDVSISSSLLYREYIKWCEEWGEHQLTMTSFGRRLSDRGLKAVKQSKTGGTMYRQGVALASPLGE